MKVGAIGLGSVVLVVVAVVGEALDVAGVLRSGSEETVICGDVGALLETGAQLLVFAATATAVAARDVPIEAEFVGLVQAARATAAAKAVAAIATRFNARPFMGNRSAFRAHVECIYRGRVVNHRQPGLTACASLYEVG